ncbi:MAG: thioredoxin family protein [Candidatus Izemoplasmatales bacterium]|nr:thioredoxin family protein [Candidatus Izemoplasmatales bacterium]MDD4595919.1 thioredoxin family protein [Candidatus Izemoplasmatales bacterium]
MEIIRFSALWCMSCLVMKSQWNKVLKHYPDLVITDFDYDDQPLKVAQYKVGNILPVVIFEDDNKEVLRITGEKSYNELIKIIGTLGL